jgi:hypothetical protein
MTVSRGSRLPVLLAAATLIGWLVLGSAAHAQVFKPRGKTAAAGKAAPATTAAARKAALAPAATPSKKPTRAMGPNARKVVGTPPAKKPRHAGKRAGRGEDVKIEDDDDDVKITDD